MRTSLLSFFLILYLCFLISLTFGKRSYYITLDTMNCSSNPKYVSNKNNCYVDKTLPEGRGFADFQLVHEVPKLTFAIKIEVIRSNNERITIIDLKDGDGCAFMEKKSDIIIMNIYREILLEAGDLPKCPVPKGYHFAFNNLRVDAEKFPPYFPEASFAIVVRCYSEKDLVMVYNVYGQIIQKRKMKNIG